MSVSSGNCAFVMGPGRTRYLWFGVFLMAGCLSVETIPISYSPESAKPFTNRIGDYDEAAKAIAYWDTHRVERPV